MNIKFLCPNFLSSAGGAEVMTRALALELARRGHGVSLVTAASGSARTDVKGGIAVRRLRRFFWRQSWAGKLMALEHVRGGYRLAQALARDGRAVLLANGPDCPGVGDPRLYKGDQVAVLMGFNTAWEWQFGRIADQIRPCRAVAVTLLHAREPSASLAVHRRWIKSFDHYATLTDYEKDFLAGRGWPVERITTVGVGSDTNITSSSGEAFRERHGLPRDAPLVLFIGRKIYNKGIVHLVQAMDDVWDRYPGTRLVLMGFPHNDRGWLESYLRGRRHNALALTLNLDHASEQDREDALEACSVMAMPSISDSFGIVYLDAWRHSKPIIGCRNTCCESFVKNLENGLLVDFGNVQALSRAILRVFDDTSSARAMGAQGRETWSAKYRWPLVVDRMELLFKRVIVSDKEADKAALGSDC